MVSCQKLNAGAKVSKCILDQLELLTGGNAVLFLFLLGSFLWQICFAEHFPRLGGISVWTFVLPGEMLARPFSPVL